MADVAGPTPIPQSDPRLAVAAVLISDAGDAIGKATVLSSEIAITAADLANSAQVQINAGTRERSAPPGRLMLFFPQYVGAPGVYPLSVRIQAVDRELGFGVLSLSFSGGAQNLTATPPLMLPVPVPSGLLGAGEVPADGSDSDILYSDSSQQKLFFRLSGRVEVLSGQQFRLRLEGDLPSGTRWSLPLAGAPVFSGHRLVGIVAAGPYRQAEPGRSGFYLVDVLSVAAMARSEVTPAIRDLLPRLEADPSTTRPVPASMEITQIDEPETQGSESSRTGPTEAGSTVGGNDAAQSATLRFTPDEVEATPPDLRDPAFFARLSPSSRHALERAYAMQRRATGQGALHMECLIVGLFDKIDGPTQRLFGLAKIDRPRLVEIVREAVGTVIPEVGRAPELTRLPSLSKHVREALAAAAKVAGSTGPIRSRDLLYGVLSVGDCRVVQALARLGVRKEDIVRYDPPPLAEEPTEPREDLPRSEALPGGAEFAALSANPTPKVDSDLWSQEDRLGYEVYARTIASLITHKETKPPLTIGIKAPWGAGKTTLMKRVQHLLDGYAELSEGSRIGILQEAQPPAVTLRELLRELKDSTKPEGLPLIQSKEGKAYGLPARTTVWFNAWKYQTSEQIWAGMAHCIISQITARMKVKDRELFWVRLHARRINVEEVRRRIYWAAVRYLVPVALVVLVACAIVFWLATVLPVGLPTQYVMRGVSILGGLLGLIWTWRGRLGEKAAGTMRELIREPDYEGKMGYLHLVESDIREVLQLATAASVTKENPNGNPLVVFVDDLDRCAPYKVAEVVEAINLFLCGDYPNCIFVLGMEPGMAAAALEVANKDVIQKAKDLGLMDRAALVGWRFMEKIVQLPIMIPPPTEAGSRGYVGSLTGLVAEAPDVTMFMAGSGPIAPIVAPHSRPSRHGAGEEAKVQRYIEKIGLAQGASEVAKRGIDMVAQAPVEERWAAREAGNRVYGQALSERDPAMAEFAHVVARLVNGNPRQIKRYVNVFRFYSTLRHSFRLEGSVRNEDLPSDKVLAKFVALSIQWPHAVDCMRVLVEGAEGKKVSLLKRLETESRGLSGDSATADEAWKKVVDELKLPSWAEERAFREFLAREESLCEKEGHGLW